MQLISSGPFLNLFVPKTPYAQMAKRLSFRASTAPAVTGSRASGPLGNAYWAGAGGGAAGSVTTSAALANHTGKD